MLIKELKNKGSNRLNNVLRRKNAYNNDIIIRLYFNDWTLIQSMRDYGKRTHAELKEILNNIKMEELKNEKNRKRYPRNIIQIYRY